MRVRVKCEKISNVDGSYELVVTFKNIFNEDTSKILSEIIKKAILENVTDIRWDQ